MNDLTFGILHWALAATGVWLITGTLLNFSSHPHWYIRGWDFPRVLTAALAAIVAAAWAWTSDGDWRWWEAVFLVSLVGVVGIQVWNIYPYTRSPASRCCALNAPGTPRRRSAWWRRTS
jgi:hypothetical protein